MTNEVCCFHLMTWTHGFKHIWYILSSTVTNDQIVLSLINRSSSSWLLSSFDNYHLWQHTSSLIWQSFTDQEFSQCGLQNSEGTWDLFTKSTRSKSIFIKILQHCSTLTLSWRLQWLFKGNGGWKADTAAQIKIMTPNYTL